MILNSEPLYPEITILSSTLNPSSSNVPTGSESPPLISVAVTSRLPVNEVSIGVASNTRFVEVVFISVESDIFPIERSLFAT